MPGRTARIAALAARARRSGAASRRGGGGAAPHPVVSDKHAKQALAVCCLLFPAGRGLTPAKLGAQLPAWAAWHLPLLMQDAAGNWGGLPPAATSHCLHLCSSSQAPLLGRPMPCDLHTCPCSQPPRCSLGACCLSGCPLPAARHPAAPCRQRFRQQAQAAARRGRRQRAAQGSGGAARRPVGAQAAGGRRSRRCPAQGCRRGSVRPGAAHPRQVLLCRAAARLLAGR